MEKKELFTIGKTAQLLGVSIDTLRRWDKKGILISFRPSPTGNRYYRSRDIDRFLGKEDILAQAQSWVSDRPITPPSEFYCQTRDIFQARLERLQIDLKEAIQPESLIYLIAAIAGEIGNNAFDHNLGNWPDIPGLYFRYNLEKRQMILADRGQGILKTLRQVRPRLKTDKQALKVAFTEIISGRAPESRGNGLKFVREIVSNNPLRLLFYSGNAFVEIKQDSTELAVARYHAPFRGTLAVINF